jgi:ring-1,2-phenylacetyl-CoA epoxidase subunit PaaD
MRGGRAMTRERQAAERRPATGPSALWEVLEAVSDPEIPGLSIRDLGVLRDVEAANGTVTVTITPTYSGCPAMTFIEMSIRDVLLRAGAEAVEVKTVLAPSWTTDWLTEAGRAKLRDLGIAPPEGRAAGKAALFGADPEVPCPRCGSKNTRQLSRFGSTACKALYHCDGCLEPFDYFKCI